MGLALGINAGENMFQTQNRARDMIRFEGSKCNREHILRSQLNRIANGGARSQCLNSVTSGSAHPVSSCECHYSDSL